MLNPLTRSTAVTVRRPGARIAPVDSSRDEHFDMLPNRFRKHRGKDRPNTVKRRRQREPRHPFAAEKWCAFTAYL